MSWRAAGEHYPGGKRTTNGGTPNLTSLHKAWAFATAKARVCVPRMPRSRPLLFPSLSALSRRATAAARTENTFDIRGECLISPKSLKNTLHTHTHTLLSGQSQAPAIGQGTPLVSLHSLSLSLAAAASLALAPRLAHARSSYLCAWFRFAAKPAAACVYENLREVAGATNADDAKDICCAATAARRRAVELVACSHYIPTPECGRGTQRFAIMCDRMFATDV